MGIVMYVPPRRKNVVAAQIVEHFTDQKSHLLMFLISPGFFKVEAVCGSSVSSQ